MTRYDDDDDDDDAFDENGLLKDGRRMRVSMMMRDGTSDVQRAVAEDALARRFGLRDAADLYAPGPRYCTDQAALDAKAEAYRQMVEDLQNAYKTSSEPTEAADQRRKRKVTTRDPFGRETGSWEEEKEDAASDAAPTMDAAEGRRRKQVAYDAMAADLCNSWRNPSPLPVADAAPPLRRDAVPLGPTYDAAEGRRIKQEAYARMCAEDREAWKGPGR